MRISGCVMLAVVLGLAGCASASGPRGVRDFYFSPRGDDRRGDGSAGKPFATLGKASALVLRPGDRVLLEGGAKFRGSLLLDAEDGGDEGRPVVIGSFGQGRAEIEAGGGPGVLVRNCGHVEVRDLVVRGSGMLRNMGSGVAFWNERLGGRARWLRNVAVRNVEASGFGLEGIHVDALGGMGFEAVRIEDCIARDNGHCGIYVTGRREVSGMYGHRDVKIARCEASRNLGNPHEPDENRSGSGIFLTGVDGAVVEKSVAYENGRSCKAKRGGPMGIWASESNGVVIQYCESYANRTGGKYDGGGFGIDGGTTNCVVQYNYSHDNEGSGFGLFQYAYAPAWRNNTVRYNVSENDGRKNGYAGIHVWNGGTGIVGAWIYHNTIVMKSNGGPGKRGEASRLLWVQSGGLQGLRVLNNVFVGPRDVALVDVAPEQKDSVVAGNCYWVPGGEAVFGWEGVRCRGIDELRARCGQERGTGWVADPKFVGNGDGVEKFAPGEGSVLVGGAVDLGRFGIAGGGRDVGAVPARVVTSEVNPGTSSGAQSRVR